jgi:general secretion pathway protein D
MKLITWNSITSKVWMRWVATWLVLLLLGACATETLHKEGMSLLAEGRYEEGLAKLKAASDADPQNLGNRVTLQKNRDVVNATLMASANVERANGHPDAGRAIYERVLRMDPGNAKVRGELDAMAMDKRHDVLIASATELQKKGESEAARIALKSVLVENPRNAQALAMQRQMDDQTTKDQLAVPVLQGKFKKPVTLQFRDANLKMVFEAVARLSGINILLDKDVKSDLKTSIFVKDVSVEDTIGLILLQSQLEKKVIGENTVFVYPNTPAKLKDYQDLKIRSFHLTSADPKQIQTMLKTLLKTKDIFIHEKTNSIVIRDTPEAIRIAEKMIADQDFEEPEVMLEVEVLEVARERITDLGLQYPDQISFTAFGGTGPSGAFTLNDLRHITSSTITATPALGVTLNLKLQDSDSNVLASPRIRAKNHEKAKIMIGDRVPIITNAITPVSTGSPVVTGNVQYLDVGLKLEVEPDIHTDNEIIIKVNMDVSTIVKEVQNTQSGTLAYQVGTRNAATVLRLKDGETQILAGLINSAEQGAASKVPLLGQLPIAGRLFSNHTGDSKKTEIVLSITPHIVGSQHVPSASEVEYWSGSETTLRSDLLTLKTAGSISMSSANDGPLALRTQPAAPGKTVVSVQDAPEDAAQPFSLAWQGPSQAAVGERIALAVNTQTSLGLSGIGFVVGYDPKVLKAVDVAEGDFFKQATPAPVLKKTIDPFSGQVMISLRGVSLPGTQVSGATGSGGIVMVTFDVIGTSPQSQVSVSRLSPIGTTGATMTAPVVAPHILAVAP